MASIKFFDSHIHIYTGCEGRCTKLMDTGHVNGMNLILLTPSDKEHKKLNEEGYALKKKYGKMIQLAYWVDLKDTKHIKAAEKAFKEHPEMTGIKIHPGGDGKVINEKNLGKIFDFAKERNLYIISHTDPSLGSRCINFQPVMQKRKDLRLILGHSSPIEEAVILALGYENCYVEPCWLAHFSLMFEMMERLFKYKKFLVGTDGPMRFHRWEVDNVKIDVIEEEISYARKMMPNMQVVQRYCYDNAIEFFKIAEK